MAIAHVCIQCGLDLVRIRVQTDPHYGLPLVICPRCAAASVRRVHPIWARWRATSRVRGLLCPLAGQILCITLLSLLTVIAVEEIVQIVRSHGVPGLATRASPSAQYAVLLLAAWTGTWLTVGLGHWRRPLAFAGWGLWIAFLLALEPIIIPLGRLALGAERGSATEIAPLVWAHRLPAAAGLLALSLIGLPLGWFLSGAMRTHRRTRWRIRRKTLRRRRGGKR